MTCVDCGGSHQVFERFEIDGRERMRITERSMCPIDLASLLAVRARLGPATARLKSQNRPVSDSAVPVHQVAVAGQESEPQAATATAWHAAPAVAERLVVDLAESWAKRRPAPTQFDVSSKPRPS